MIRWLLACLIGLLFVAPPVLGQMPDPGVEARRPLAEAPAEKVELVGQVGGASQALAVAGDYAYLGVGPRLLILDISREGDPALVGQSAVMPGIVYDVAVANGYAYVANGEGGLRILDVTNPAAPVERGVYRTATASALSVAVSGTRVYLGAGGLRVVDVSDVANPRKVAERGTPGAVNDIALSGNFLYVANGDGGLLIFDITNPANPVPGKSCATDGNAMAVAVAGDYGYVAAFDGLQVIGLASPQNPECRRGWESSKPGEAIGVAVAGSRVYLANSWEGLWAIDVSNPNDPVTTFPGPDDESINRGLTNRVVVADAKAYAAFDGSGLQVFDVAAPAHDTLPAAVGLYQTVYYPRSVTVDAPHAYIAAGQGGLAILDITHPSSPSLKSLCPVGDAAVVALQDRYAYVADAWGRLQIIDVAAPSKPECEEGSLAIPPNASDLAVLGSEAHLAANAAGLWTISAADPRMPEKSKEFTATVKAAYGIAATLNRAYVADGNAGLRIIDIARSEPAEIGYCDVAGTARAVSLVGNLAYVAAGDGGLKIFDVADPANCRQVGALPTRGPAYDVAVWKEYAYVAVGPKGLDVIRVADPEKPAPRGYYDTAGNARGVTADGRQVFLADSAGGLYILNFVGDPPVYAPLVFRPPPPPAAPVLEPITAPEDNETYPVWWKASERATSYVLQRSASADFLNASEWTIAPAAVITQSMPSEGIATYFYRVQARNETGSSPWSNAQSVEVRWEEQKPNGSRSYSLPVIPLAPGKCYYGILMRNEDTEDRRSDYFRFNLSSTRTLTLTLGHMQAGQDFDLALRSKSLPNDLQRETRGPYDEVISNVTLQPGEYDVQVWRFAGDSRNPYHLCWGP